MMKKLLLIIVVLALVAGGVALYLKSTTPSQSRGVAFPLQAANTSGIATDYYAIDRSLNVVLAYSY